MSTRQTAWAAVSQQAHNCQAPSAPLTSEIDRVRRARIWIARQITDGEEWMLPLLQRFNTELAKLEEKQDLFFQAAEIANHAAPIRAA